MNKRRSSNQRRIEENSTRVTEIGREIQMVGPADLNPHELKTVLTCRTHTLCALEEQRACKGTQGWTRDERYGGAMVWSDLKVRRAILKWMRAETGSQWRCFKIKKGLSWTEIWNMWPHEQECFGFSVCKIDSCLRCWTDIKSKKIKKLFTEQITKININPFATGDAYMRPLFRCLQWYAGSERVNKDKINTN